MKNKKTLKKEIPVFFASDDNYLPFLDVTLVSLIEHASREYFYSIYVLNTGLSEEGQNRIKRLEDENFSINFVDMTDYIGDLHKKLKNVYHFSLAAYYRLFIQGKFPQYKKILYLDCDIVVLGDISKLYNIDLEGNMLGGVVEGFIQRVDAFNLYAREAIGVNPSEYINSGILVMDLEKFREENIEEKFTYLLSTYNFDTIDPDQAYLNYFCRERKKLLPISWNKTPAYNDIDVKPNIIHFALTKKPWQCDVPNAEYFWYYAKKSDFYNEIVKIRENFSEEDLRKKEQAGIDIMEKALQIVASRMSFYPTLISRVEIE